MVTKAVVTAAVEVNQRAASNTTNVRGLMKQLVHVKQL